MAESMPNLAAMTLDELTEYKVGIKNQISALQEQANAANVYQNELILAQHVEAARTSMQAWADANGKTLAEAIEYWNGRLEVGGSPGRWTQALLLSGLPGKVRIS